MANACFDCLIMSVVVGDVDMSEILQHLCESLNGGGRHGKSLARDNACVVQYL